MNSDPVFYYKLAVNLFTVTMNIFSLGKLRLIGAMYDIHNAFHIDAKIKMILFKKIFINNSISNDEIFQISPTESIKGDNNETGIDLKINDLNNIEDEINVDEDSNSINVIYKRLKRFIHEGRRDMDCNEDLDSSFYRENISIENLFESFMKDFQHTITHLPEDSIFNFFQLYILHNMIVNILIYDKTKDANLICKERYISLLNFFEHFTMKIYLPGLDKQLKAINTTTIVLKTTMEEQIVNGPIEKLFWLWSTFFIDALITTDNHLEALPFLNRLIDVSTYSYSSRIHRTQMFYYRALVLYKQLKRNNSLVEKSKKIFKLTTHHLVNNLKTFEKMMTPSPKNRKKVTNFEAPKKRDLQSSAMNEHLNLDSITIEDMKQCLKKAISYIGCHPSHKLYSQLHYLFYKLYKLMAKNNQTLCFHLAETASYHCFRYRLLFNTFKKINASKQPQYNIDSIRFRNEDFATNSYMLTLPKTWRFVQIKLIENGTKYPDLLLCRFQNGNQPYFVKIKSDQHKDIKFFMEEFTQIMKLNSISIHETEKKSFWRMRFESDFQLKSLLDMTEQHVFGLAKGIFMGQPNNKRYLSCCSSFRKYLLDLVNEMKLDCQDSNLLNIFIESIVLFTAEETVIAAQLLFNTTETGFISRFEELRKKYFSSWMKNDKLEQLFNDIEPVGLIIDQSLNQFPFESLPSLRQRGQPFFRIPSVKIASFLYEKYKQLVDDGIDDEKTFYLLNPGSNLASTETFFKQKFLSINEWNGFVGTVPNGQKLAENFETKDIYVYMGHGSGSQYYRSIPNGLDVVNINSLSIVVGCSSGRVTNETKTSDVFGSAYRFLINGAPVYIGALWDVTDKDIDLYMDNFMSLWLSRWNHNAEQSSKKNISLCKSISLARDSCKLRYLNGCATVVYARKLVLGIETSCDDTGIAIVDEDGQIISEVCASQTALHVSNGGIIPPVARDLHKTVIDRCVSNCLHNANVLSTDLSAIAVTIKPGLPLSLLVGCNYAKKLSAKYSLPVLPIHHMEAHALTALIEYPKLSFPFVTLLISGGHSIICFVKGIEDFRLMGQSTDDAPGDIMDKAARALKLKNLGPPFSIISGGAAIELMAKNGDPFSYFCRVKSYPLYSGRHRTCNFSFSGFLTAILRKIRQLETDNQTSPDEVLTEAPDLCASILYVISFILIKRLQRAFQYLDEKEILSCYDQRKLVVSGGCAANRFITGMIRNYCHHEAIDLFIPSSKLCTDNGVMIAWNGQLKLQNEKIFPHSVLREQQLIQMLDIDSKAKLGLDISKDVTNANIKCERIDIKNFVNFL
ncbi:tRNA N6-adenosine threonylcarbamoyltransferase, mitochondrial-like [Euroglyphus maynei]|uniref:N(6)-L-threonylcarbamoyladenine synthase n=1 Tax=Euroglyphus maynei TaxID=6958 RepID=A0A1Y3AUR3_EURMA|nr:tRNA N6-adenosine threonylcarbamoyltransferase, mitochondrial-like [Euroglyphus maynei]